MTQSNKNLKSQKHIKPNINFIALITQQDKIVILSDINTWKDERLTFHPIITDVVRWIEKKDILIMEVGKHNLIEDNKLYCLIQEVDTSPLITRRAESHFNYIDLQFLCSGQEKIGISRTCTGNIIAESDKDKDIIYYSNVINESVITMLPGMFAVFFPNDIHRPCGESGEVSKIKKAVFKIHTSLFS